MRIYKHAVILALAAYTVACSPARLGMSLNPETHFYLEEIEGEQALSDVQRWNERSLQHLRADPRYKQLLADAMEIANSEERIPHGVIRGGFVYNFWQDGENVRGLWRRSPLAAYLAGLPVWETLLDIDKLAGQEKREWVFKGVECLESTNLCMVALSDGGKDAVQRREFDIASREFVQDGFYLPEAKSGVIWADADNLLVATDWGEDSLTDSGYPYIVKLWRRGQPLEQAKEMLRGQKEDVGVWPHAYEATGERALGAVEADSFFTSKYWVFAENLSKADNKQLPLPPKSTIHGRHDGYLLASLEQDWQQGGQQFASGDLIGFDWSAFRNGQPPEFEPIFSPKPHQAIEKVSISAKAVLITLNDNVARRVVAAKITPQGWVFENLDLPENGTATVNFASPDHDTAFVSYENFLTPDTLGAYDSNTDAIKPLKSLPAWFDASAYIVEQAKAVSSDGTAIPYYLIRRRGTIADGGAPTLLYGYGGFQISLGPYYSGELGRLWLDQGGVYVLANIRGGGEFGPKWHQAALKTKRQTGYDDFIAIAEHLIERGITSPERLAVMGGSNGGLLVGVMYVQRPDLWKAVLCQVPLLDMLRYHTLLAGASWVDEYGSPEIAEERAFLERISPYHNIDPAREYPEIFLITSTRDDRVHPSHARKMAKRLEELGKPFLYYENTAGGHSAASNRAERAKRQALEFTWLAQKLIDE